MNELGNPGPAVNMAEIYILQTPRFSSSLTAYLEDFCRHRRDLLSKLPDENEVNFSYSIMTVWEMSYDAMYKKNPEASRLLQFLHLFILKTYFLINELFCHDTSLITKCEEESGSLEVVAG